MYTMKCDGEIFYSPFAANEGYAVIAPKINNELNKAGSLEFTLPPDNVMYNFLKKLKSIITVEKDGEEIFRGRVLHDDKDFSRCKYVYCEGELAYLMDSVIRPFSFSGSVTELFMKFIQEHNSQVDSEKQFRVGIIEISDRDIEEQYENSVFTLLKEAPGDWETNFRSYYTKDGSTYYPIIYDEKPEFEPDTYYRKDVEALTRLTKTEKESTDYTKTYDAIMNNLIDEFGGYLRIRYDSGTRYLDYVASYGENSGQVISCGVNMLDLSEYITAENIITCLIPTGGEVDGKPVKIDSVNEGSDYIQNNTAIRLFGKIWGVQQWEDITNPEKLKIKAEEYLNDVISMNVSINVKAVDLNLVDVDVQMLKIGESVRVVSEPHELDAFFTCSGITLDLVEPDKSSYTFGYAFNAMTDQQTEENKRIYQKIASSRIVSNKAKQTAEEALNAANSARSYASGAVRQLKKNIATLIASDKKLQAGISAKVSPEDLNNALVNYALKSALNNYLTVNAAAELYATDDDVLAVIGAYVVTDKDGNKKSLAAILADQIRLQGRVDISGNVSVADGQLTVLGNLVATNSFQIGKDSFYIAGKQYTPTSITSTSGAVLALGIA